MQKLPLIFVEKLKTIYSAEELKIIETGFSGDKRPTTFRVNTLKSTNQEIEKILQENNIKFEKISYLSNGYKLLNGKEKDLWDLDIFKDGKIYLQGITSQMIGEVLKNKITSLNIKVLDLTAAPGGKTSHISAILENNGEIIANELNAIRMEKLDFTIKRQGCQNVKTVKGDAKNLKNSFESGYFDIIIADLPCSAEGRVNIHNEKSYAFLEKEGINNKNYKIQKEILQETIDLLKDGGVLIYSTCTLDPRENEGIVHFLLSNFKNLELQEIPQTFPNEKPGLKKWNQYIFHSNITKSKRILPSSNTEGFYIALFKKVGI